VVILIAAAIWLETRSERRFEALLAAVPDGSDPVQSIVADARARRFLFIADVPGTAGSAALAGRVIERLASTSGLDALVVAVAEDQQQWINQYLRSDPEDATPLMGHPDAAGGAGTPLLALYRDVWRINRQVGAARSVRIVAAGMPATVRARSTSPARLAGEWAERDAHMLRVLDERVLAREARARVVFFLDGLHALDTSIVLRMEGASPVEIRSLAALLSERQPREVWSVLVDPPSRAGAPAQLATYTGTAAREVLRRENPALRSIALPIVASFGQASDWIRVTSRPGSSVTLSPPDASLADVADVYVYLQN
jgi:hypothetical protein